MLNQTFLIRIISWDAVDIKKILVVDDNDDILYAIKHGFEKYKDEYLIYTANKGIKSLELLDEETPDLILLDILMPEMDGWEVLNELKRNSYWRDIPVFMIISTNNIEFIKKAKNLDVPCIEKPFTINELKEKFDSYFSNEPKVTN